MSDTETLTYKQWVDTIFGEGSEHGYITYVKEKERKEKKEREETELKGVDNLSDREVQNRLLILTARNSKRLNNISNILTFFLALTIISIVFSLAGLSLLSL